MKTSIKFFKAANVVLIITGILHLIGHFSHQKPANDEEKQFLDLFHHTIAFYFLGHARTMKDLFDSISLSLSVFTFFIAFFNFMLVKNVDEKTLLKVILQNVVLWLVISIIMLMYAFAPPISCYVTVWLLMMISYLIMKKEQIRAKA